MKTYLQYIKESVKEDINIRGLYLHIINKIESNLFIYHNSEGDRYTDGIKYSISVYGNYIHVIKYNLNLPKYRRKQEFNGITYSNKTEWVQDYYEKSKINSIYIMILKSILKDFDRLKDKIINFLNNDVNFQDNRLEYNFYNRLQNDIKNSYRYQKYLIDKGEISKLKDVKLNDKILQEYPEMRDIKKQSEWS